jgi:UDP-N-acetylmuramate dehydrogenase
MPDLPAHIQENVDLSGYTTMGVKASASFFSAFESVETLRSVTEFAKKKELELLILGGGSNLLFVGDFSGLVAVNKIQGREIISEKDNEIRVKVGGGVNWHEFVLYCVEQGWGGIENLSLIPGTVGAAPIQNIGAYGVELKDVFYSLEAFDLESRELRTFNREQCNFGYRDSIFKKELKGKVVITSVTFSLHKDHTPDYSYRSLHEELEQSGISNPTIEQVSNAVIKVRQSKLPDPAEIGNTGSFFKNPVISVYQFDELKITHPDLPGYPVSERLVKVPAGWLIEQAGWKGFREGDAGVHDKQALVLVNHGSATGEEIWELAGKIRASVLKKFDVALTPEVNIIG